MRALWPVFRLMLQSQRRPLLLGGLLSAVVLAMGTALLGLSGWFITASAGSEVDQSTWFTLLGPAQPPAGTPTFTVAFARRADGTYRCAPLDRSGGG